MVAISAMSNRVADEILRDRPCGGTAILGRKCILSKVKFHKMNNNCGYIAISFETIDFIYLIANMYMSCFATLCDNSEIEIIEFVSIFFKYVDE